MKGLHFWSALLLLVSGLILLIPALYTALSSVTAGRPWVQIILGLVGVIVSLAVFAGKREGAA